MKVKIESRKEFWKKKYYKTIESGKGWKIERPFEFDINKGIKDLLRRKEKWE